MGMEGSRGKRRWWKRRGKGKNGKEGEVGKGRERKAMETEEEEERMGGEAWLLK